MASRTPASPSVSAAACGPDSTTLPIPQTLWNLRVPLYITHKSKADSPFITAVPRFSYLAQLLPRLSLFFGHPCTSFHHEEVQLRNHAVGLLVDLYQPQLPWRLEVGDGVEWDIGDTFLNGVKEVSASSLSHGLLTPLPGPLISIHSISKAWQRLELPSAGICR